MKVVQYHLFFDDEIFRDVYNVCMTDSHMNIQVIQQ